MEMTNPETPVVRTGHLHKSQKDIALVTFLRACAKHKDLYRGRFIHAYILRRGLIETNIYIGNTLVSMYAKWGALEKAWQVFDDLPVQNVVAWTALIAGYAQNGHGEEALRCFKRMQCEGLSPEVQTFSCILKACGSIEDAERGEEIHAEIARRGLLEKNIVLGNAIVDMYAKCGSFVKAQQVLDELPFRNEICWNGLITGFSQHGQGEKALDCFERMQDEGLSPNAVTYACALKACGGLVATERGAELHGEIVRKELLDKNSVLGTALVDMYIKCGELAKAQQVFDGLTIRNVVSWTALMAGYAEVGKLKSIFDTFNKMITEGVEPNPVTFVIVLNACRYVGSVNEGQTYFETMSRSYGIVPTFKHHICMVGLFGGAGYLDKAMLMMKKMPSSDYLLAWSALLSACQKWGNVKLGSEAFHHAV